jgi:hypothetical protein
VALISISAALSTAEVISYWIGETTVELRGRSVRFSGTAGRASVSLKFIFSSNMLFRRRLTCAGEDPRLVDLDFGDTGDVSATVSRIISSFL